MFDVVAAGGVTTSYDLQLLSLLRNNVIYQKDGEIIFLIQGPFDLGPGDVVIASPTPTGGAGVGLAGLGYNANNSSGIIMTKPNGTNPINVSLGNPSDTNLDLLTKGDKLIFHFCEETTAATVRHGKKWTSVCLVQGLPPYHSQQTWPYWESRLSTLAKSCGPAVLVLKRRIQVASAIGKVGNGPGAV